MAKQHRQYQKEKQHLDPGGEAYQHHPEAVLDREWPGTWSREQPNTGAGIPKDQE